MKYFLIPFLCTFFSLSVSGQETNVRPKIGLTLSGGGAKGLAHIGILKAIDSAGLKIDYITGTSMGAIIGSLYAAGYSANDIEKIARKIDWDVLLSNQISLPVMSMEEKEEYNRFIIELPYINKKIRLPSGVIKGQELDLKFSELFAPYYQIKDFNKFKIPFKCMATDLETGELVVLENGNIISSVRASMAIPSVFTDVTIDGKRLLDGGLVRNFPVKNVIEMGADYVIGSNVSSGLSTKDKINNPVDVILQLAFFKEAIDFKEEIPLTNLYIYMPVEKYGTGSFGSSKQIINRGIEVGKKYYPQFKKLADSVALFPDSQLKQLPSVSDDSVFIKNVEIKGLKKTTRSFFLHMMNFDTEQYYNSLSISKAIRRAYGSRYYNSITYTLENLGADSVKIIFEAEENPNTYLKAGIYFSKFRGINTNLNVTSRDFLIRNSRSMISVSIGESMQMDASHFQYLGRNKGLAVVAKINLERLYIETFNNFKLDGAYKQLFYKGAVDIQNSSNNRYAIGAGTSIENIHFNPAISSIDEARGNFSSMKTYIFFKYNTLNKGFYPTRGARINTELGRVYNQEPSVTLYHNGLPTDPAAISFDDYTRFYLDGVAYIPINSNFNMFTEFQSGINFTDKPNVLNNFSIGGLTGNFRNQIKFAGFQEATLNSPSAVMLQAGLRYNVINNLYLVGRFTSLVKDFVAINNGPAKTSFLSGYALTFAYKSPIGPVELSMLYSDQSRKFQSYVSIGIPF